MYKTTKPCSAAYYSSFIWDLCTIINFNNGLISDKIMKRVKCNMVLQFYDIYTTSVICKLKYNNMCRIRRVLYQKMHRSDYNYN